MGNSRETPAIQPTPLSQRAGIKKRNYEEYKKYKKEDEGGRLCRRGCIDLAEQSRDALGTLAAAVFFPELNMSRENQIPGIPTSNLLGDHQTGDARENAKESDIELDLDVGSAQRKEGSAAERVVPIFIELQLTLKYFPAKRPCWPGVGRRLAGLWIQDGGELLGRTREAGGHQNCHHWVATPHTWR